MTNRRLFIEHSFGRKNRDSFVPTLALWIQAFILLFIGTVNAEELGPATVAVKQTIDQVLAVLDDPELKDPKGAEERRAKIRGNHRKAV